MPPASSPLWSIIRLTILMATLTGVLFMTASKFDYTEVRTLITMFFAAAGLESFVHLLPRKGAG